MISNPDNPPHISVVTPVYGCRDCLDTLYQQLVAALEKITPDFEIIMVNDASPDHAWETIAEFSQRDKRVKGINFSRNFGQHYALSAGLHHAAGDWVVVMDCDLQDSPGEIGKLYAKAQEGFDVVFGKRVVRQDNSLKKLGSRLFWATYDYFTEQKSDHSVANFSIISRKVVDEYCKLSEQSRTYVLSIRWLGFKTVHIPIDHGLREVGRSSYTLRKLVHLAADGIVAHSNKPLKLAIGFGFGMAFVAILFALKLVYDFAFLSKPVAGWTSVMVSMYFLSGILMANMGLLGVYLGRIFNETKGRPIYVIQDQVGFTDANRHPFDTTGNTAPSYSRSHPAEHSNKTA
ncbi:glycosyltransferase family 2 protein [Gammaproteobacteria bacterium]|nr:glycosyltransferase family 2 protein [Gammaproteobacteria bacterium]